MTVLWPAAAQPGRNTRLAACAGAALAFHAAVLWLLLPHDAARTGADAPPSFEIEMVDQAAQIASTPAKTPQIQRPPTPTPTTPPAPTPPAPTPPAPSDAPAVQRASNPPTPDQDAPEQAAPDPAPPPPPAPQQAAAPPPKQPTAPDMAVNLSSADAENQEALRDIGDNVVPPRPDATYINKPPHYPIDAARRHAEGTVTLIIHITEAGIPGGVDIAQSSGDPSLDRSARDAAALWRFQPATDHGVPVPTDLPFRVSFSFGRPARAFP